MTVADVEEKVRKLFAAVPDGERGKVVANWVFALIHEDEKRERGT